MQIMYINTPASALITKITYNIIVFIHIKQLTNSFLKLEMIRIMMYICRLLDKLMCVINYMEMARVTGVPLSYLQVNTQSNRCTLVIFTGKYTE